METEVSFEFPSSVIPQAPVALLFQLRENEVGLFRRKGVEQFVPIAVHVDVFFEKPRALVISVVGEPTELIGLGSCEVYAAVVQVRHSESLFLGIAIETLDLNATPLPDLIGGGAVEAGFVVEDVELVLVLIELLQAGQQPIKDLVHLARHNHYGLSWVQVELVDLCGGCGPVQIQLCVVRGRDVVGRHPLQHGVQSGPGNRLAAAPAVPADAGHYQ
mmetsp:Transcript_10359/g.19953  ORF Transcript_10359/g.19953 Transcript_10359/m.19953 type:complete len:217 (+) Transcript_10359:400-1050(+)